MHLLTILFFKKNNIVVIYKNKIGSKSICGKTHVYETNLSYNEFFF